LVVSRRRLGRGVAHWQLIGAAASWAAGVVMAKAVLDRTDARPSSVLCVELAGSICVLAISAAITRSSTRGAWRRAWIGLLEPGIAYQFGTAGLALTSAVNASVIVSLEPALVPLVAWVVLRRRPERRLMLGMIVATAGSVLVSIAGAATFASRSHLGDVLIVGEMVSAALYVVLASRHPDTTAPVAAVLTQQLWAMALVLASAVAVVSVQGGPFWPAPQWGPVLLALGSGVLNYALPFALYLSAMRKVTVNTAATYLTLVPVIGVTLSWLLLGDVVRPFQFVGVLLVMGGLGILARSESP
jgi:drug/metabolite transporter (DMT)-like permease